MVQVTLWDMSVEEDTEATGATGAAGGAGGDDFSVYPPQLLFIHQVRAVPAGPFAHCGRWRLLCCHVHSHQLVFCAACVCVCVPAQGQTDVKEVHFHRQVPGLLISTAADGFNFFVPNITVSKEDDADA